MAYCIIKKTKNGIISEIPISTYDLFHEYWLPLFEKYEMRNLSNWRFLHDLEKDELKNIINEFNAILPHITGEWEKERANFILKELRLIKFEDYEYINIG
ncbi:hypothetical protein INQ45_10635 [Flavobacterium columnare]|uniref:hypothetical protein n=1 Tax=Flavobacterium columnare TaxID=996 RepID=UPI002D210AD8|nr:hypothetical protein [Flavobacterium columnare]MEB3801498.1 hypothetical protein [Flavobacterium columnare]